MGCRRAGEQLARGFVPAELLECLSSFIFHGDRATRCGSIPVRFACPPAQGTAGAGTDPGCGAEQRSLRSGGTRGAVDTPLRRQEERERGSSRCWGNERVYFLNYRITLVIPAFEGLGWRMRLRPPTHATAKELQCLSCAVNRGAEQLPLPTNTNLGTRTPHSTPGSPLSISCHRGDGPCSPAHVGAPGTPGPAASAVTSPGCRSRLFPAAGRVCTYLGLQGAAGGWLCCRESSDPRSIPVSPGITALHREFPLFQPKSRCPYCWGGTVRQQRAGHTQSQI